MPPRIKAAETVKTSSPADATGGPDLVSDQSVPGLVKVVAVEDGGEHLGANSHGPDHGDHAGESAVNGIGEHRHGTPGLPPSHTHPATTPRLDGTGPLIDVGTEVADNYRMLREAEGLSWVQLAERFEGMATAAGGDKSALRLAAWARQEGADAARHSDAPLDPATKRTAREVLKPRTATPPKPS